MKRFLDRFQLWRQERAAEREDKFIGWLLFLAVVILGQDAYTLITSHQLTMRGVSGSVVTLAFIVLYIRQARWTWIPLAVVAVTFLADATFAYLGAPSHLSNGARVFVIALLLAVAVGAFIYSLILRRRFADAPRTI